ncbi:MAG: hypothetical protein M3094_01935, partial [Actinomycetia bacterium]|nr:hypothetical protein [Actinomycetes bacterium]
ASWFVFGVGAVVLALLGLAMYDRNRSPIIVTLGLLVATWLFAPFAQARPVIVSYVFIGVLILVLRRKDELLWLLVPLFWVWAGVHGSWALGGVVVVLELLRSRDLRLLKVGIVSLAVTVFTAHGLGTWQILYDFSRAGSALGLIAEWQPPNFGGIAQASYLIVIVGLFVGFARGNLEMRDLIVIVPFLFYGMTSERAVFPAAIVLLPFSVAGIPSPNMIRSATAKPVAVAAMVIIGGVAFLPMIVRPLGVLDQERFPNDAVVASIEGRTVFHDTAVGGYLIYAAWPDDAVYIDDRAELYGFTRLEEFLRAQSGDYADVFERYSIEIAIVKPDSPLARRLAADGWSVEVESDQFVTMAVPPDGP